MTQKSSICCWKLGLTSSLSICAATTLFENCSFAQITPDNTLGAESSVVTPTTPLNQQIEGGATRGTNLFHSFEEFSIPLNGEAHFNNNPTIQNIISRVTGSSASIIDGSIKTEARAGLFLINPNGVIFGANASLNIGGSFIASTASSLNFADGTQFSATTPQTASLLTISVPVGLQFGTTPGSIVNRSQASLDQAINTYGSPAGLQVQGGKTLALVGGDLLLEGGNLTAAGGRIELGSVDSNSLVSLKQINTGWEFGYEGVQNFQDIQMTPPEPFNQTGIPTYVDVSGEGGGEMQLQGRLIRLNNSALIAATTGELQPGNLTVNASESLELDGYGTTLTTLTSGSGDAGDITINTGKLLVQAGAQVFTSTSGSGSGGNLSVNASDSVKLSGSSLLPLYNFEVSSSFFSATAADGDAGDLKINTKRLVVQQGARVSTESAGTFDSISGQIVPATGRGGNLTINASDSVELSGTRLDGTPTGLLTSTQGGGNAGDLAIATRQLRIQDQAEVAVSSEGTGDAGNLHVRAGSIRLDNAGKLTATTQSGRGGGNITLQDLNILLLRSGSEISTNAGGEGNGGNINIDTSLLAALENSNITANADEGRGGNIQITTQGLFLSPDSNISATSEQGIDGVVEINRPEIEPSAELVDLPVELVDVSRLIAQGCSAGGNSVAKSSEFIVTGRGGLPPTPTEALRGDTALVDLGESSTSSANRAEPATVASSATATAPLVEAQGWTTSSQGEVVLTAQAPNAISNVPWLKSASCN